MTRVLLIADTERVHHIFQSLEEKGALQLQAVSTLEFGDSGVAASSYDFTFVQSRISGLSGTILLRHLDKVLSKAGRLVLLDWDSEDVSRARKEGRESLDLSLGDPLLEQSVVALLTGAPLPAPEKTEAPPPVRSSAPKTRTAAPPPPAVAADTEPDEEPAAPPPVVAADIEPDEEHEPPPVVTADMEPDQEPAAPPLAFAADTEPEVEPAPPIAAGDQVVPWSIQPKVEEAPTPAPKASPFEEVMQRAAATIVPIDPGLLEVEDRVELGKGPRGGNAASAVSWEKETASWEEPAGREEFMAGSGGFRTGETLAEAMRRVEAEKKKSRRSYFVLAAVAVLIAVPLCSYLLGRNAQTELAVASAPAKPAPPARTGPEALPAPAASTAAHGEPRALPVAQPSAQPERAPSAIQEKQAPKRGLEKLPSLLEGTRLDPEYGKSNPGWVRYIGLRAEYKLFKENDRFQAVQVMARGEGTVTDEIFTRMLKEFGGADGYRVESSDKKGNFVVEQCSTTGSAGLTIYRASDTRSVKAFVVYYR